MFYCEHRKRTIAISWEEFGAIPGWLTILLGSSSFLVKLSTFIARDYDVTIKDAHSNTFLDVLRDRVAQAVDPHSEWRQQDDMNESLLSVEVGHIVRQ